MAQIFFQPQTIEALRRCVGRPTVAGSHAGLPGSDFDIMPQKPKIMPSLTFLSKIMPCLIQQYLPYLGHLFSAIKGQPNLKLTYSNFGDIPADGRRGFFCYLGNFK